MNGTETMSRTVLARSWARLMIAVVTLGIFLANATIALTGTRAARGPSAAGQAPLARAYGQDVPSVAQFHTVMLTVLDDETNQPLSDTEVTVLNSVDLKNYQFKTDARGQLRFTYPYVGGAPLLDIELRKNGYVPLRHGWGSRNSPEKPVDALAIRLRRGMTMGGIVVYLYNQPVEGVTVVMTVSKYGPGKRPKNPAGSEIYYEVASRTGPDGRWRTDSVPPGTEEVHLQLLHPDFVSDGSRTVGARGRNPKLAALRDQTDRQVLRKGVMISGRVVDADGKPIAGAEVVDSTAGLTFLTYVQRAFTDQEGRFHFQLGRGGDKTLTATARGFGPISLNVAAEPNALPIEFRLARGRLLRARVVDPQGKPIAGACIGIPNNSAYKGVFFRAWSDAQGRFQWQNAPAGSVDFSIGADGYNRVDNISLTAGDQEAVVVLNPLLK